MARKTFVTDTGWTYVTAMDGTTVSARHLWAVVTARMVDEITLEPVGGPFQVEVTEHGLSPLVKGGGWVVLVGRPFFVFPDLAANPATVHFTVRAPGYLPLVETANFAAQPGFPGVFSPRNRGDLLMRR